MDEDEAQKQVITYKLSEKLIHNVFAHYKEVFGFISHIDSIYVLLEA